MLSHALVVKIIAKADRSEDVDQFLSAALPLAQAETFTPIWFAFRANATTFYIVDAFSSADDRQKHLEGQIAAALMSKASELLAEPPSIEPVEVIASKLPISV
ncbi:MAG: antibiotic biosynthesis monooxygenase [Leptolyngbya sp. SIO1E4]|nr:antibiotic biosynthesis monooxygenase [Leptolyngbya sp. SIO1E4]